MWEEVEVLFLYTETPLRAGKGGARESVDIPLQREPITELPYIASTSLKGVLHSETYHWAKRQGASERKKAEEDLEIVFGSPPETPEDQAVMGSLRVDDGRLLALPVRALKGLFAWTTCPYLLHRFQRDLTSAGLSADWPVVEAAEKALVPEGSELVQDGRVVLEEYDFEAQPHARVTQLAQWLAKNALPSEPEYGYWRKKMETSVVVLPDEDLQEFSRLSVQLVERIRMDYERGVTAAGALWSEEYLPTETLFYAPVYARRPAKESEQLKGPKEVLDFLHRLPLERIQIGSGRTIGRGMVHTRFLSRG